MAKLVRHLTSNEEIVSSNLAEGIFFASTPSIFASIILQHFEIPFILVFAIYNYTPIVYP